MRPTEARAPVGRALIPSSLFDSLPETLRLYAAAPLSFVALAALLQGPLYVLLGALTASSTDAVTRALASAAPQEALCAVLGSTVPLLLSSLLLGGLYLVLGAAVAVAVLQQGEGAKPHLGAVGRVTSRRLRPLLGGSLLALLVVGTLIGLPLATMGYVEGCFGTGQAEGVVETIRQVANEVGRSMLGRALIWLALVLALGYVTFAAVNWLVLPQVALFEGGAPAALLWRSRTLVRGRWWTVAAVLLALLVVQSVVAAVAALPFTVLAAIVPGLDAARSLGPAVGQVIGAPIGAIGTTLIYLRLRHEGEGLDEDSLAALLGPA